MRLVNTEYQIDICLNENEVYILVVENPIVYTSLVQNLWNQCEGNVGTWILSDGNKALNLTKNIKCIINPFSININDKMIITKLYQELKYLSDENLLLESSKINIGIINYLDKLSFLTSYPLTFNVDFNLINLLKMYDLKLDTSSQSFLEKIVEYLKILNQICHINIFVFIGLKHYLTKEDIQQLYEFVFYEKIYLLLIESNQYETISNEKIFIIDKDLCIIDIEKEN